MSYSNYCAGLTGPVGLSGDVINIQTPSTTGDYTSPSGLIYTVSLSSPQWIFNVKTPTTPPVWGYCSAPYFTGYVCGQNGGSSVTHPNWLWSNLPLGKYQLTSNIYGLGAGIVTYNLLFNPNLASQLEILEEGGGFFGGFVSNATINANNTMNIGFYNNNNTIPSPYGRFTLYKLS